MAAAAAVPTPGDHACRRQWRYTWEALGHLPLLRLYVFPRPALPAAIPSGGLRADLRLEDSLLLLSFSLAGEAAPVALRVPVPRVLVDPAAPVECRAAGDHVEVRLALVLPVDHPVVAAAFPPPHGAEPPAPLVVRDDLKSLSTGDVHLYCKNCSARLTKQALRKIMEMPSVNWEDVADNWFGGCCTSFSGAGEKLVAQFINAYGRLEGTSLLDTTAITIETDYLESDLVAQVACSASSDFSAMEEAISDVSVGKGHASGKIKLNNSEEQANITTTHAQPPFILEKGHSVSSRETNGVTLQTDQSGTCEMEIDIDVNFEKPKNDSCVEKMEESNKEVDLSLVDPCHGCCVYEYNGKAEDNPLQMSLGNQKKQTMLETKRDYKLTKTISLGSGFIVKASNLLNDFEWVELLCGRCLSPLGSYPSQGSLVPADGRLRLFKCYTSTELPVMGPHDVFRGHTLERVFVNLLLEVAEDEISFRTLVRDLKTKRPILQLVLLSSKAWLSSGCCDENDMDGSHGTADLQPSVKLLYSDYSNASEADLRYAVCLLVRKNALHILRHSYWWI
uniref:Ubiquitin-conjugating enzyme E2C-binding protein n=1 Tax=Setaria italica TaxID=4555 RepID=K3YRA1_SETIT